MYFCQFVVINLIWLVLGTVTCVQLPCRLAQDPNCTLAISYHPQDNLLAFHLDVKKLDCQWLAIGFNTQPSMIGTTVIVLEFTENFRAYNGFLKYYNEPIYENNDLVNFELEHLNGRFGVKFKRSPDLYTEGALNFSNCNFVVVGVGALVAGKFYTHVDTPVYSDSCWTKLDFNQITTRSDQIFTSSELSSDVDTTNGIELTNSTKFTTKNLVDDEAKMTQADLGAANNSTRKLSATSSYLASDSSEFSFFSSNLDQDPAGSTQIRVQTTEDLNSDILTSSQEFKRTSLTDEKFTQSTESLLFPITTENYFSQTPTIKESQRTSPKESITLTDNLSFSSMASSSIHQTEEDTSPIFIKTTAQSEIITESTNTENLIQSTESDIGDDLKNTTAEILIQSSTEINMIQTTKGKENDNVKFTTQDSEISSEDSFVEDLMETTEGKVNDTEIITTEDSELFTDGTTAEDLIKTNEGNDTEKITTQDSEISTDGSTVENLMETTEGNDDVKITTQDSEVFSDGTTVENLMETTEGKVNDTEKITTQDSEISTDGSTVENLMETTEGNDDVKFTPGDSEIFTDGSSVEDLIETTKGNDDVSFTTEDSEIFTVGTTQINMIQTTKGKSNDTDIITTTAESTLFTESSPKIEPQTFTVISRTDLEQSTSFEFLRETTKNLLETTQIFDLDNTSAFESSFISDSTTQTLTSTSGTFILFSQTTLDSVDVETTEIDNLTIDILSTRTSNIVEQKTTDFKITTINSTQIFATKSEAISIDSTITSEFLATTKISTFEMINSTEKIETSIQTSSQAETTKLETSNRITQNTETTTSTDFIDEKVTVPDLGSKINTTKLSFTIPSTTTTATMTAEMTEITDMVTNSSIAPFVDFLFLVQMRLGNSYLEVVNETQAKLSQNLADYTKKALMDNDLVGYESIILLNITESERLAILFSLLKYKANAGVNDSQLKENLGASLKNGDKTILNVNSVSVQKYSPSIDKPVESTTSLSELKTNTILAIIFGSVFGALTLFLLLFICLMFYYCFKRRRSSYYIGGSANDYLVRI